MQTEEIKKQTGIVDSVEALTRKIAEVRAAIEKFSTYTQEQVDKIFLAAATAADKPAYSPCKNGRRGNGNGRRRG